MVYEIHHAAALLTIGYRDEAYEKILALKSRPEFNHHHERFINPSLVSPTYSPGSVPLRF
jgi:hypothetical protein